jgi:CHASE3 domain sensor protein
MGISIKTKIIGSFVVLYCMLVIVVCVAHHRRNLLVHGMLDLETAVNQLDALIDLQVSMERVVMPANDYLITGNFNSENVEFQNITSRVEKEFNRIEGLGLDRKHVAIIKRAKRKYSILKKKADKIFSIQHPIGNVRGSQLMKEVDALAYHI